MRPIYHVLFLNPPAPLLQATSLIQTLEGIIS